MPQTEAGELLPLTPCTDDEVVPAGAAPRRGALPLVVRALAAGAAVFAVVAAGKGLNLWSLRAATASSERLRGRQSLFDVGGPSVFCWALARTNSYEVENIATQYRLRAGLFSCTDQEVFSDKQVQIGDSFMTTPIGSVDVGLGGGQGPLATGSWVNTVSFLKVWRSMRDSGRYLNFDWTIKVDPDTVFFPEQILPFIARQGANAKVFFNNCPGVVDGFYGSIEIMSRPAVQAMLGAVETCTAQLQASDWGEDLFAQRCMQSTGAVGMAAYDLVEDGNCQGPGFPPACHPGQAAAFHPFKSPAAWEACYHQVNDALQRPMLQLPMPSDAGMVVPAAAYGAPPVFGAPAVEQQFMPPGKHPFPVEDVEGYQPVPREAFPSGGEGGGGGGGGFFSHFALPSFHRLKK